MEAEDEVDMMKVTLKTTQIKLSYKIGVVMVKEGVEEVDLSQKWIASSVASTINIQTSVDQ